MLDPDLKKLQELGLKRMEELRKKQQGKGGGDGAAAASRT